MHQLSHRRRTTHDRQLHLLPQNLRARVSRPYVPQHPRPEPDPIEEALIRFVRHQIGCSARIERPGFRRQCLLGHGFEVVSGEQGEKGRLFILELDCRVLLWGRLGPGVGDGGGVQSTDQFG